MQPLSDAMAELREYLLDPAQLRRAVAAGRRRHEIAPPRVELRWVSVKKSPHLQVLTSTERAPLTSNYAAGSAELERAVDEMLARPYGNWHVETGAVTIQLRVTKKGEAQVHRVSNCAVGAPGQVPLSGAVVQSSAMLPAEGQPPDGASPPGGRASAGGGAPGVAAAPSGGGTRLSVETPSAGETSLGAHDRVKHHLLAPDDPLFTTLGADGDKRRQVDAFLRHLDVLIAAPAARARAEGRALTVVDLGCGNAYLTLAAHHWLSGHAGVNVVRTIGIEMREDVQRRNRDLVARLGLRGVEFVVASISEAEVVGPVDVVLALHACDTATDDALARAVQWRAPVILAAPCCHHDIQRQITEAKTRGEPLPEAYRAVVRSPILRERFCDVLTDALRAHLLEGEGYQVDVVEFIDSKHTPRNALIRARRTGRHPDAAAAAAHAELVHQWRLHPALADRLVAGPPKPDEVGAVAGASVETGVDG